MSAACWLQPWRKWKAAAPWPKAARAPTVQAPRPAGFIPRFAPRPHSPATQANRLNRIVPRRSAAPISIRSWYSLPFMAGIVNAAAATLIVAAFSTFGDFVWARWITSHRAVFGLLHGTLLCLGVGLCLGALRRRPVKGALAGAAIGLGAAAGYYALAWVMGYAAMFVLWMALWAAFGLLQGRGLGDPLSGPGVA